MLTLYFSPGSCALSPHVALHESGLPFDLVKVDLGKKLLPDGNSYWAVNPKGYVPALRLEGGEVLTENAVMIQYIADLAPELDLAPKLGTFERVRMAELLNFIATELHKGMGPFYNPKATDELKASLLERLTKRFEILGEHVATTRWIWGDRFTVADGYAFYVLRAWQRTLKRELPGPNLAPYYGRLVERPSVRRALEEQGIEP